MQSKEPAILMYKRSRFTTALPVAYRYSPSHYWLSEQSDGAWRVGLTKFATRMLGEMVDYGLDVELGSAIHSGQILGWIEGFKAISDIYCVAEGKLEQVNPLLKAQITVVNKEPYTKGWLYALRGGPDAQCLDVHAYQRLLDKTIDKILEKQSSQQID